MQAISITMPDELAKMSQVVARELHISRAHLIRIALEHEIAAYRMKQEQAAMAETFQAMKSHPSWLMESDDIMEGLNTDVPEDGDAWWK